jgi:hypothetical protein
MRAVRMVLAVLCFVKGAAFALGAAETIFYSRYDATLFGCLQSLRRYFC